MLSNLDPDQNVGPDLNQNCLTLWWYSRKNFAKNDYLRKMPGGKKHEIKKYAHFRVLKVVARASSKWLW